MDITRFKSIVGHDLITKTFTLTARIWGACHVAQEVSPITGAPLLYKDPELGTLVYPVDKLKIEVDRTLAPITPDKFKIDTFLAKTDSTLVSQALDLYGVKLATLIADMVKAEDTKTAIVSDKDYIEDKVKLAAIGEANLPESWEMDKEIVNIKLIVKDHDIFLCNCGHNSLDALSYNLRGIDPGSGNPVVYSKELLAELIDARTYVARVECNASTHPDSAEIIAIANWVTANRNLKPLVIADYIDAHLPKIPLIRRYWA